MVWRMQEAMRPSRLVWKNGLKMQSRAGIGLLALHSTVEQGLDIIFFPASSGINTAAATRSPLMLFLRFSLLPLKVPFLPAHTWFY